MEKPMTDTRYLMISWLLFVCITLPVSAQDKLVLSSLDNAPISKPVTEILRKAYQRLGIELEVRELPGLRGLHHSVQGVLDGEAYRLSVIEKRFPTLVRIDVPLHSLDLYLFVKKGQEFDVEGWSSIPDEYVLCYLGGRQNILQAIEKHGIQGMKNKQPETLFKMLEMDRCDVALASIKQYRTVKTPENAIRLLPPVESHNFYHYLNEKHVHLAPEIQLVLSQMKASGELQSIFERYGFNALASEVETGQKSD